MYEFTSNIRYSECAPDARLSLAGLVNYFQDCAVFHAIDVNRGPDTWKNEHYGWIITSWQIVVNEYPMVGEEVTTATWAYKFKGFEANRNLTMRDKDGKLLAYANSSWAYFDTAALRPLRIPSYEMDAYGLDPELPMENKAPRRIRIPAENYRTKPEIRIRVENLDSNGHVNNEQYIALMIGCLPAGLKVEELRVQYISQARLGDTLVPKVWHEGNEYIVWLELDGKSCCTSYFRIKEGEALVPIAPGIDLGNPGTKTKEDM
ncbi:MAG: hypothetical protein IKI12_01705 [Lachnospiraceae bacterium]|nr:hypothetical protein [Lachnospiraceae bacterium]